jgi:hypothetical protein
VWLNGELWLEVLQEEQAQGSRVGCDLPLTDIKSTGMTADQLQRRLQHAELEEKVELYVTTEPLV